LTGYVTGFTIKDAKILREKKYGQYDGPKNENGILFLATELLSLTGYPQGANY
jgi:hypothetical protein